MKLRFLFILTVSMIMGCATPVQYTNKSLHTYDQNTEYSIDENDNGFTINVLYSRYQFIPESDVVLDACKSNLKSIAYEIAESQGRKIKPINEQRIKVSMGRNGITGVTSCAATAPVEYELIATDVLTGEESPKPIEHELVYDEKTQRGHISVKGKGLEARPWMMKKIGEVCSSKNIVIQDGTKPEPGYFRVLDEKLKDGKYTIEFEAIR